MSTRENIRLIARAPLTLKALIITIADDIFCNNLSSFWVQKDRLKSN